MSGSSHPSGFDVHLGPLDLELAILGAHALEFLLGGLKALLRCGNIDG
jgi:hypothetical protein